MKDNKRSGKCLCGSVSVQIGIEKTDLGVCHCSNCQKWASGPFMELECGADVQIKGMENISTYRSSS